MRRLSSRGHKDGIIRSDEEAVYHFRSYLLDLYTRTLSDRARYGNKVNVKSKILGHAPSLKSYTKISKVTHQDFFETLFYICFCVFDVF